MNPIKGEVIIRLNDYHYLIRCENRVKYLENLLRKCVVGCDTEEEIPEKNWKYFPDKVVIEMCPELEQEIRNILESDAY